MSELISHEHWSTRVESVVLQVMVQEDSDGVGLIAHFVAHATGHPIAAMAFDPSGTLLLTADCLGHSFHMFRLMVHPLSCALGAVHHLYTLFRGETSARVSKLFILFLLCPFGYRFSLF